MAATAAARQPDYTAFGTVRDVMRYTGTELVFSGPAGTGKTRGGLEKLDVFCRYFPGCRTLIARKTRASLTQSTLVEFEHEVLRGRFSEKPSRRLVYFHGGDMEYRYPNGSVAVTGGLDKAAKIMSSQYDMILVDEGTETTENDYESLTTRLRNGKASFQQLLLLCNPDSPVHYLKKRHLAGKLRMIDAQHTDNPRLFDHATGQFTEAGIRYMKILDDLTGARKLRLKDGIWCMTDGMVFDGFRGDVHVFNGWNPDGSLHFSDLLGRYDGVQHTYSINPPQSHRRTLSIDFGYANPFVCQFWSEDEDGRLYNYREIYQTHLLVEDAAAEIIKLCELHDEPAFDDVICDWDAEDRATLERHLRVNWRFAKLTTTAAEKSRKSGCDAVQTRLKPQGDGRPRIFFRRDAVVRRDPELETQHKPQCTIEEIYGYVYDKKGEPTKENDHGCDSTRYRVATTDLAPLNTYQPTKFRR